MFVNLSSSISFFSPIVEFIKHDRLKAIVSYLALGILFTGTVYWICSRFWQNRHIQQESSPDLSPLFSKKLTSLEESSESLMLEEDWAEEDENDQADLSEIDEYLSNLVI